MWETGPGKCKMGTRGMDCPGCDTNNSKGTPPLALPDLPQSLLTSKGAFPAGSEQVWDHSLPTPVISKCKNGWTSRTITQLPVQQVGSCEIHPSFAQPDQS